MLKEFIGESELKKEVLTHVLEKSNDYNGTRRERIKHYLEEVLTHDCQSGIVSILIYYHDTVAFYTKHQKEINDLLYNLMESTGIYNLNELLNEWDTSDPLVMYDANKNKLAWFAYETICYELSNLMEEV